MLNDDARFAFPFGDGYWSLLLDRSFVYEDEIERFLRARCRRRLSFVDGGANFGYWSVLASSRPFGSHPVIAIEASSANAAKLARNAELNGGRFKVLHRAIGATTGNQVWLGGAKHEAFRGRRRRSGGMAAAKACEMIALDSLLDEGLVSPGQRLVIKLDVEGMEIEAAKGGKRLLAVETVIIVEDHGADRDAHGVASSARRRHMPVVCVRPATRALRAADRSRDARPHQDQHCVRLQRVRHQQPVLGRKDQVDPAINASLMTIEPE